MLGFNFQLLHLLVGELYEDLTPLSVCVCVCMFGVVDFRILFICNKTDI